MLQTFLKFAGPLQALLGAGGAAVPAVAGALGSGMGGSLVNLASGGLASYLGFSGSPEAQQRGAQFLGVANLVVAGLGAAGVHEIAGIGLNQSNVALAINAGIGIWGVLAGFMKK